MKADAVLIRLGGVSTRATLIACTSRRAVDRALRRGEIVRDGHGRYSLPSADQGRRTANGLSAVLSHRSAATHWGWEQKLPPSVPDVTVPRNRKVSAERQVGVNVHWMDLASEEVQDGVTIRSRTLADCLRALPFDEALAIADSAIRHRDITLVALIELSARLRGPGSAQARDVARLADGRAANPFESVLRAIASSVPGLHVEPQVPIDLPTGTAYVDLADRRLAVVAEADSFAWHGSRRALWRDCHRYNRLVLRGWLVLRFAWEDVMFYPEYVRACLQKATTIAGRRARARPSVRKAA